MVKDKKAKSDKSKKMVNAYMHYCVENRQQVRLELRNRGPQVIAEELGARWRSHENREKERYGGTSQAGQRQIQEGNGRVPEQNCR